MSARAYTTHFPEAIFWHDLNQLAEEQAVLMIFRNSENCYAVDTRPPDFLIRKARPTKLSTEYWVQIKGQIETQDEKTVVMMRPGYTDDGKMRLGLSGLFCWLGLRCGSFCLTLIRGCCQYC